MNSKNYSYEFDGTADEFDQALRTTYGKTADGRLFCYIDNYIVEKAEDNAYRFGIERKGHSGGNWFVSLPVQKNGKTVFEGEIEYRDSFTDSKRKKNPFNTVGTVLLCIITSPILIPVFLFVQIKKLIDKPRKVPSEPTAEERLDDLMVNYLNCRKTTE